MPFFIVLLLHLSLMSEWSVLCVNGGLFTQTLILSSLVRTWAAILLQKSYHVNAYILWPYIEAVSQINVARFLCDRFESYCSSSACPWFELRWRFFFQTRAQTVNGDVIFSRFSQFYPFRLLNIYGVSGSNDQEYNNPIRALPLFHFLSFVFRIRANCLPIPYAHYHSLFVCLFVLCVLIESL